jgi:ribosome-binding factor A
MNFRTLRVGNLIREELGALILRNVEFDGALVTITEVDVTKKLDTARVKVSIIPSNRAKDALASLTKARGELQFQLGRKLNIKPMPKIMFEIDHRPEHAAKVEKILLDEDPKTPATSD